MNIHNPLVNKFAPSAAFLITFFGFLMYAETDSNNIGKTIFASIIAATTSSAYLTGYKQSLRNHPQPEEASLSNLGGKLLLAHAIPEFFATIAVLNGANPSSVGEIGGVVVPFLSIALVGYEYLMKPQNQAPAANLALENKPEAENQQNDDTTYSFKDFLKETADDIFTGFIFFAAINYIQDDPSFKDHPMHDLIASTGNTTLFLVTAAYTTFKIYRAYQKTKAENQTPVAGNPVGFFAAGHNEKSTLPETADASLLGDPNVHAVTPFKW